LVPRAWGDTMSHEDLNPAIPNDFSGVVRLFPLPNVVLFPHVILPLHIFEPRYCEMLEESLATDRLISMALLMPGWENDIEARPNVAPMTCLGKIISHTRLPEGRHNIMLAGLRRAAIAQELPPTKSFRRAKVELLDDYYPASGASSRPGLQRKLLDAFRRFVPKSSLAQDQFEQLLSQQISLGMLTDIVAFTINLPLPLKQQLLNEWHVDRRAALLFEALQRMLNPAGGLVSGASRVFPPEFSAN
jgi:Lon protease-like protein